MKRFWPHHTTEVLLYIGDAYDRCIVTPVRDVTGVNCTRCDIVTCRQAFVWPDGTERWVPVHTVVVDSEKVRAEKGLL